ncbi:hypothetical protein PRIC1_010060 [Phytophthora ramorum]
MRLGFFLLVVVFTLAAGCYEIATALTTDSYRVIADSEGMQRNAKTPALRRLNNAAVTTGGKSTRTEDEERGLPGYSKLKEIFNTLPGIHRLQALLGKNPSAQKVEALVAKSPELSKVKSAVGQNPIKVNAADVKKLETAVKKKEVHPAISVTKSVLKMLAVVGIISLSVGAIVYVNENY